MIDTVAEETFITDTIARIKREFRHLVSLKAKWFVHRILPADTLLVEWKNRGRLELEIDLAQWFSSRDKLTQLLWYELAFIRDELDPAFGYPIDYVRDNYGPGAPRERFYHLIRMCWCVTVCGRLSRKQVPVHHKDVVHGHYVECYGTTDFAAETFNKLFNMERPTFTEIETIAKQLYKNRPTVNEPS